MIKITISLLAMFACLHIPMGVTPGYADTKPCLMKPCEKDECPLANQAAYAKVRQPAPPFTLDAVVSSEPGKEFGKISLSDYKGKWVILFFYPYDFSFVCPTEIKGFNTALDEFKKLNAMVLGVSVDSKYSHLAWMKRGDLGELKYPLLSDIKKEVTERYGILDEKEGVALRGLFIIDPEGIVQHQSVNNFSVGRNVEETLRVLEALQTGELCPLGWKPGKKTLGK